MKKRLFLSLRWLTALAILISLAVLGYQCISLYQSDTKPLFSAEKAAAALRQAAPLLLSCLVFVLLSLLLHLHRPIRSRPVPLQPANRLRLMKKRISALPPQARQEEKKRRFILLLSGGGVLCCVVWCLAFLLNKGNFISWDLEPVLGNMLLHVVPALGAAGLMLYISSVYADHSREKECRMLSSISREMQPTCREKKSVYPAVLRIVLLSAAILFIVLGALNGDMWDVMNKAIKICTECIGLG